MQLLEENDPFLKIPTSPMKLSELPDNFFTTIDQMINLMYEAAAIGLAAPQVGLPWRVFVMDSLSGPKVCINPEILKIGDIKPTKEGCLSFPNLKLIIHRPNFIKARYQNLELEEKTEYFDGIEAVCFGHELDHLDGITFETRVSKFQFANALKKRKKLIAN